MGQSYDRRINLYINVDGKQVANDVKSIRSELQKVINEQNRMTIGSDEYVKQTAKIKQLNGILAQHRAGLKEVESPLQKVIGFAKNLLPAFGLAALGGLAQKAFGQIIAATDTLGTKWDIFLGGVRGGLTELWRTIASGNWSNFITNMSEAVRVGREYQSMLDTIEEKSRALRMIEANANREALELEVKLRNKTLTNDERLAAGQARIKLEEELSRQRVKIAQDEFDSEMMLAEQQTRLSKERILEIIADIDSEKKAQALKYNEILAQHEAAKKMSQSAKVGLARAGISDNPFAKEVEATKAQLDSFPDSVKVYAEAIRGMGITTDEQLNKVVASFEKLKSAENSSLENTKRVTTMVNSLLAGKEVDGATGSPGVSPKGNTKEDIAGDALELAYKQQIVWIKERYEGEETLQKEYQARMLANELSYLMSKQELFKSDSEQYLDLQSQIITKQNEYNVAIRAMGMELLSTDSGLEKFNARLLEQAKLLDFAAQKHNEGATESENLKLKTEQQRDVILQTTEALSDSIYMLASGGEDAMKEAGKNMILFALDMLKMQTQIAIAGATVQSLMQPDSILTFGASGLIRAAILVGLIEAAFAGVKGLVISAFSTKTKKSTGYSAGGFTGEGGILEPAGIVHRGEWVAPNWMLDNPFTADIIRGLESWRRNPVTLTPGAFQATNSFGHFSKGGYTGLSEEAAGLMGSSNFFSILAGKNSVADEKQNEMILKLATAIENLMKWKPTVYSEMIKKDLDTLDEINRNSGL